MQLNLVQIGFGRQLTAGRTLIQDSDFLLQTSQVLREDRRAFISFSYGSVQHHCYYDYYHHYNIIGIVIIFFFTVTITKINS